MSKWTWVRDEGQELWMNGFYETKEAAICDGRDEIQVENKEFELENREKFYIGKCDKYIPGPPNADLILEQMWDRMNDEFQPDIVEDFMNEISVKDDRLLQRKLEKAWNEWMEETQNYPNFYKIIEVEEVNVYPDGPGQQKGDKNEEMS